MPINPLIALQGQVPDVGQTIGNALTNVGNFNAIRENQQTAGLRKQQALSEADLAGLKSDAITGSQIIPMLEAQDIEGTRTALTARRDQLKKLGLNTSSLDRGLVMLDQDPSGKSLLKTANDTVKLVGLFDKHGVSAGLEQFRAMTNGLSEEDELKARRIELGLDPRAVGSSSMTIAETGKTDQVAGSQAVIAGAKAGAVKEAELDVEIRKLPDLKAAVSLAESDAKARGETLTELSRAKAALPGLEQTISSLKELAPLVTYTYGGKVYDEAAKQLGFGATEGSTARAKFIATVNNQVLPLLRDTFGAAFTAREGDELKAAMADPNSSPDEKLAQLDAFIDQKYKQIQTNERQLGQNTQTQGSQDDPLGILQ